MWEKRLFVVIRPPKCKPLICLALCLSLIKLRRLCKWVVSLKLWGDPCVVVVVSLSLNVTPRSRNTYLVAYSNFSIVFFDLLSVFILYYELFIWSFCLGSGFVDSESALFRICHSCDANPASVISCVCDSCVCSPASHFQNPRPLEYIPLLSFPLFLSPPSNADLTYLGFCIYCEDPPHVAFNALQIKSHQLSWLSLSSLKRSFASLLKRHFHSRVWPIFGLNASLPFGLRLSGRDAWFPSFVAFVLYGEYPPFSLFI